MLNANLLKGQRFTHPTGFHYEIADQQGAMLLLHDEANDNFFWVQRVRLEANNNLTVAKVVTRAEFTLHHDPMRSPTPFSTADCA